MKALIINRHHLKKKFLKAQKEKQVIALKSQFYFPLKFLQYESFRKSLLKNCYTNLLNQKKIFMQYLYEFHFLKFFYFSYLFYPSFKQNEVRKDFFISHTVRLYIQQIKFKTRNEALNLFENNESILNYSSELQIQIYKITSYSKLRRKQNTEFYFFKIHLFILKYIIKVFELKSVVFPFQQFQDKILNYSRKSLLSMLQYLFFKNFISECINFVHLNNCYYRMNFKFFYKSSTKSTSLLAEFIKKLDLPRKLNLIMFNFEKNYENYFPKSKFSFDNLEFIYRKFKFNALIFMHFNASFLDLNKNISALDLLFLESLTEKKLNPCFSKHLEKQLIETFIFDKIVQLNFYLLKKNVLLTQLKNKNQDLKNNQRIVEMIILKPKGLSLKFLKSFEFFNKHLNLQFSNFLLVYKSKNKFSKFLEFYFCYYTLIFYIEKNDWQFLLVNNQNFPIFNESSFVKMIEYWFSSKHPFLKLQKNLYLYTFKKDLNVNNNVKNKIVIIYKNFLFVFLSSNRLLKLPTKWEQKTYLNSLKKTIKTYSNKNQTLLIEALNEKIYVWSYSYRFIFIQDYFVQLDQKLFKFLWTWAIRRHNNKSKNWIKAKYFHTLTKKNWIFGAYVVNKTHINKLQGFIYTPFHAQILFNFRNSVEFE